MAAPDNGEDGELPAGTKTPDIREPGNIYLTCLRLRFEERGSWSKALARPSSADAPREQTEPLADESELAMGQTLSEQMGSASPSWRERAGLPPPGSTRAMLKRWLVRRHTFSPESTPPGSQDASPPTPSTPSSPLPNTASWRWLKGRPAFGWAGANISLASSDAAAEGASQVPDIANRDAGTDLKGVVLTALPLPNLSSAFGRRPSALDVASPTRAGLGSVLLGSFYFEIAVLDVVPYRTRTLSLGFCWDFSEALVLPDMARDLPRSLIAGGDLPVEVRLGGRSLCKLVSWRPIVHVVQDSIVGALLEVWSSGPSASRAESAALRLVLVQDDEVREIIVVKPDTLDPAEAQSLAAWTLATKLGRRCAVAPHGVVDVCGGVRSLRLLRTGSPPSVAL